MVQNGEHPIWKNVAVMKPCNYSGTPDLTINIRKREAFATLI